MAEPSEKARQTLQSAKASLEASLERQKQLKRWGSLLLVAILVEVVLFLALSYSRVQSNFTQEKIQEALVENAPEMVAQLSEAIVETATAVVPVYVEQVQTTMVESMPEIAMAVDQELKKMSEETTAKALERLEQVLNNVNERQQAELRKQFPDLTEEDLQYFAEELAGNLHSEVEDLAWYILDTTIHHIVAVQKTLAAFPQKNLPDDEIELSRLFVHHLLQLLDEEIMTMPLEAPPEEEKA